MTSRAPLLAFIDESGQRAMSAKSSDYFIMGALAMPADRRPQAEAWLASLRSDLNRKPDELLHWIRYTNHAYRLRASQQFGAQGFGRAVAVVVCKRHLTKPPGFTLDMAYLFAFRVLLERLSWLAAERDMELQYTLGHVRGFSKALLRQYEANLRAMDSNKCKINWRHVSSLPSKVERPENEEMLQISDIIASSIGAAFNGDAFGQTETRYVQSYANRFYRGPNDSRNIWSYGLKMLPWTDKLRAAHPWVAAL